MSGAESLKAANVNIIPFYQTRLQSAARQPLHSLETVTFRRNAPAGPCRTFSGVGSWDPSLATVHDLNTHATR